MAAILYITLWRAWSLSNKLGLTNTSSGSSSTASSSTVDGGETLTIATHHRKRGWERRCIISKEFLYLLLDMVCLAPLGLIIGTLYRLPGFVLTVTNSLRDVSPKSANSESLFEVVNINYDFYEKGGVGLNIALRPTVPSNGHQQGNNTQPSSGGDASNNSGMEMVGDSLRMHVLGHLTPVLNGISTVQYEYTIWNMATKLFGTLMTSVCKSYLPLSLKDARDCNLNAFKENPQETPLWMNIDLGNTYLGYHFLIFT